MAKAETPTAISLHRRGYADIMRLQSGSTNVWYPPAPWDGFGDADQDLARGMTAPQCLTTTGISVARTNTITSPNSANGSTVYLGTFAEMMFGIRTTLAIQVLRELYAENCQYGLLASLRTDAQVTHPQTFARIVDVAF